jgi:hypothetical protein
MLIVHDTTYIPLKFKNKLNILKTILVLIRFIISHLKFSRLKISSKEENPLKIFVKHQTIEHEIRMFALIQGITMNSEIISKIFKRILINTWDSIRKKCKKYGYAQGIANSYKFQVRIKDENESIKEGENIYKITNSETGIELMLRNRAEKEFKNENYKESMNLFKKIIIEGDQYGNKLNIIKGYFGIINCRRVLGFEYDIDKSEYYHLSLLMQEVEGENWMKYFKKVKNEIRCNF